MRSILIRRSGMALGTVALLALTACQAQESSPAAPAASGGPGNSAAAAPASGNEAIRAAAEPFEALTEQAFTADWPALDRIIADAGKAVAGASLPADKAALLSRRVSTIAAARASSDRVGLALAAVEGYREIIESQDQRTASSSIAISLLDYAGFRYDALAQAAAVDWPEMARSVEFARGQWKLLAGSMQSKALPGVMTEALGGMASAVEQKDVTFARSAAATELALVDLLEEQPTARSGQ